MSDVYCVSYDAAKVLRRAGGDLAWVRRLEDFQGTEEDARRAVTVLEEQGEGWRAEGLRGLLPPPPPPPPPLPPASPATAPDVTMTFARRRVLRAIARGECPEDFFESCDADVLIGAGLVALEGGCRYVLTDDGRAYLAAHDEARTRRTERPGPPKLPEGWTVGGGDERLGYYRYEGRLASGVCDNLGGAKLGRRWNADGHVLECYEEIARAWLALLAYLRARLAYQSREARDGAPVAPSDAPVDGGSDGVGEGRPGEPLSDDWETGVAI